MKTSKRVWKASKKTLNSTQEANDMEEELAYVTTALKTEECCLRIYEGGLRVGRIPPRTEEVWLVAAVLTEVRMFK